MWERREHLKLGKGAGFVKTKLRCLPLTSAECEADIFRDPTLSTPQRETWIGIAIEKEHGSLLAMKDVHFPPPTVNDLATLLADAMSRPLDEGRRQRPRTIHLRDRPEWQELLPHLQQLKIQVVVGEDLPTLDEAVSEWMEHKKQRTKRKEVRTDKTSRRSPLAEKYTKKQGQYLAFIYYYTKIHRQSPAERDMQTYFQVTHVAVHEMVKTLHKRGLIDRIPGQARTIRLTLPREELPDLE